MKISKQKILLLMAKYNLTATALAAKIGMKPQNLSSILMRGHCKPVTAARIAEGLGVEVTEIITEE